MSSGPAKKKKQNRLSAFIKRLRRGQTLGAPPIAAPRRNFFVRGLLIAWEFIKTAARKTWEAAWYWTSEIIHFGRHVQRMFVGHEKLKHFLCVLAAIIFALAVVGLISLIPIVGPFLSALTIGALGLPFAELIGGALIFAPIGARLAENLIEWDPINEKMQTVVNQRPIEKRSKILDGLRKINKLIKQKLDSISIFSLGENLRMFNPAAEDYEQTRHLYESLLEHLKTGSLGEIENFLNSQYTLQLEAINKPLKALIGKRAVTLDEVHYVFDQLRNKREELHNKKLNREDLFRRLQHWWENRYVGTTSFDKQMLLFQLWRQSVERYAFYIDYELDAFDIPRHQENEPYFELLESAVIKPPLETDTSKTNRPAPELLQHYQKVLNERDEFLEKIFNQLNTVDKIPILKIEQELKRYQFQLSTYLGSPFHEQMRRMEQWAYQERPPQDIFYFWKAIQDRQHFVNHHHLSDLGIESRLGNPDLLKLLITTSHDTFQEAKEHEGKHTYELPSRLVPSHIEKFSETAHQLRRRGAQKKERPPIDLRIKQKKPKIKIQPLDEEQTPNKEQVQNEEPVPKTSKIKRLFDKHTKPKFH